MQEDLISALQTEKNRGGIEDVGDLHRPSLEGLMSRVRDAQIVLLGESTHGTAEFYDLRAAITLKLIREHGFSLVALEADWPDVESVNDFIHHRTDRWDGFHRFPEWMWRNHPFQNFAHELRRHNSSSRRQSVSIFGLDLYSLSASLRAVLRFFDQHHPEAAASARAALECFHPWQFDPSRYGFAVWRNLVKGCEKEVLELLHSVHEEHLTKMDLADHRLLSALQNARIIRNAEEYYRVMYESHIESWNLRDRHMFETLRVLLDHFGPRTKAVVWAHNSHLGNARATQMGRIGELNLGELCKSRFGDACYNVGFMTDHGTVTAASQWDGDMEVKSLQPAREDSYESIFHQTGIPSFFFPLRSARSEIRELFREQRLERAVGVLYLPESERRSHYFTASLSDQFDEICWVDETRALTSLKHVPEIESADLFPSGL